MTNRPVTIVVAVARNGVIGSGEGLVWRIRSDLRHFKSLTNGAAVIMGRKTFESLAREGAAAGLPNRLNIIVSRSGTGVSPVHGSSTGGTGVSPSRAPNSTPPLVALAHSLQQAIELADCQPPPVPGTPIIIGGGGEIYRSALEDDLVDRFEITDVQADPDGETRFLCDAKPSEQAPSRQRFWSHDPAERAGHGWRLLAERFTPANSGAGDEFACWFRTYERVR